ncbi:unnamed protein product [Lactuca virosa]|uniref:Uncharacterized protein n=1 Tax=Lactuca virosa TaxID=75947 RepID=A0AAU9PGL3_9ASTR|nr:unnamed protein product [Lactuca virosa]
MNPILAKLNEVLDVTHSLATGQQEGNEGDREGNKDEIPINKDEIPEVNLRNSYETWKMAKLDAAKAILEKQTLTEKMTNPRDVKTGRKGNVSFRSGKGKVNIVSELDDDMNPNVS